MDGDKITTTELIERIDGKMAGRRSIPAGFKQLDGFAGVANDKRAQMLLKGKPLWIQLVRMRIDESDPANVTFWAEPEGITTARAIERELKKAAKALPG